MRTHRVVFLDRSTLEADIPRPAFPHTWTAHPSTLPEHAAARLRDATIAITNKVPIDARVLEAAPDLQLVAVAATGVNNVDLDACRARGVVVSNVRGYAAGAVAEHVMAVILALRRNLLAQVASVRDGAWAHADTFCLLDHRVRDIAGSTLGIVGYGAIGRRTAHLAKALGMKILVAARRGADVLEGRAPLDEVIAESDVLSLHCPLTEETRGLIDRDQLRAMKRDALLINTARGELVDEAGLAWALDTGQIAGAAIDVLDEEPPRGDHPLLDLALPNLIVTPHVAWASAQAMQALADQLIETIEAFVAGAPKNVVTWS